MNDREFTLLAEYAEKENIKWRAVKLSRLKELESDLRAIKESDVLDGFQHWIFENIYSFDADELGFEPKSVVIIAFPHPLCARLRFEYEGKPHEIKAMPLAPNFVRIKGEFEELFSACGCKNMPGLPMKRLAVRSGLAEYGRNNVSYVEGFGSALAYDAYVTGAQLESDDWREVKNSQRCEGCHICEHCCPTGALRPGCFLLDSLHCLSKINESPGEFPDWLPNTAHHTLYDCLYCQLSCPMNAGQPEPEIIEMDTDDLNTLLENRDYSEYSERLKELSDKLGLSYYKDVLPRNILAAIENS